MRTRHLRNLRLRARGCALASAVLLAARGDPLELDTRRRIFEHVRRFPGLHLREVARALDMNPNHCKYHLQRLERADLVSSRREDGYWRFWPREEGAVGLREQLSRQDKAVLAVLRRPVPLHVTLLLLDLGEATHGALLDHVDVSHSTLHYHLSRMEQAEVLRSRKESRERYYTLCDRDQVVRLLSRYRPPRSLVRRFLDTWEQLELPREVTEGVAATRQRRAEEAESAPGDGHEVEPGLLDDVEDEGDAPDAFLLGGSETPDALPHARRSASDSGGDGGGEDGDGQSGTHVTLATGTPRSK